MYWVRLSDSGPVGFEWVHDATGALLHRRYLFLFRESFLGEGFGEGFWGVEGFGEGFSGVEGFGEGFAAAAPPLSMEMKSDSTCESSFNNHKFFLSANKIIQIQYLTYMHGILSYKSIIKDWIIDEILAFITTKN